MAHQIVNSTCPVPQPRHQCRWILTVGASDFWARLDVRCTPDMSCSLSDAPVWARLTSARAARALNASQVAVGAEIVVAPLLHRTVRCTPDSPVNCPVPQPRHQCRWILTVGASDFWARLDVRCTPDMSCSLSDAPVWARLTSARAARALNASQVAVGAEIVVAPLLHRTVRCTPDSPVNFSGAAVVNSRGWRVQSRSPLEHQTLSGAPAMSPNC